MGLPMSQYIVTDLTRLKDGKACMAMICRQTGVCIRPLPHKTETECLSMGIEPGAIVETWVSDVQNDRQGPHCEDRHWSEARVLGMCNGKEFEQILMESAFPNLEEGFGYRFRLDKTAPRGGDEVPPRLRFVPKIYLVLRSLITLRVASRKINLYKTANNKIRINYYDNDGTFFPCLPVTDLGLYHLLEREPDVIPHINHFIKKQETIYLRFGLTREYDTPDGDTGYWLQVNGIYSFPRFFPGIRHYHQ